MKNGVINVKLSKIIKSFLIVAIIIIGFYFCCIKAGFPYQDPTPELAKKYKLYRDLGAAMMNIGIITLVITTILLVFLKIMKRKKMSLAK